MNGRLELTTVFDGEKTVADDLFFSPPFKIYSPFYKGRWAEFISMSASAGILSGDEHKISLDVGENCNVIFTNQGYTKLFNTNGGISKNNLEIRLCKNAELIYIPHPVMTFGGSNHSARNLIEIENGSTLIFSEIYCCGRGAMGEEFALERFFSDTEIKIDGRADFIDRTLIEPKNFPVRNKGFFENYTHTGIMYFYCPEKERLHKFTELCFRDGVTLKSGCSLTEKGLAVRTLGFSAEEIYDFFCGLVKEFYS